MEKKITIETLAGMMKKGFDGTNDRIDDLAETVKGGFKLIRSEMAGLATKEDLQELKEDLKYVKEMLDSETHFIKKMETEYPIFIKRFERLEDKLGLPHHITK